MQYSIRVQWSEEDSVFVARCPELPGIAAHGDTPEEAVAECEVAISGAIEVYAEEGWVLPSPNLAQNYSGKLSLRLGSSLHAQVAEAAQADGLSINSYLQVAVARYLGRSTTLGKKGRGSASKKSRRRAEA
ncbi:MAG: type II toxin-antitoxin system HicB family antitoxin [Gemmatimonadales bacterium]